MCVCVHIVLLRCRRRMLQHAILHCKLKTILFWGKLLRKWEKFLPFFVSSWKRKMWEGWWQDSGRGFRFVSLVSLFFLFIITLTLYVFVLVCVLVCMLFNIPQHTHTPLTNVTPLFCYMFFFLPLYWKYILLWCLRICSFRSRFMHNLRCNRAIHYHLLSTILTDNHELHTEQNALAQQHRASSS